MSSSSTSQSQTAVPPPPGNLSVPSNLAFPQAHRLFEIFLKIMDGFWPEMTDGWIEYQLVPGEHQELERLMKLDKYLWGWCDDKLRYDYDAVDHRVAIRSGEHVPSIMVVKIEDGIWKQVVSIRKGSDTAASFAKKLWKGRHSRVRFPNPNGPTAPTSKREPDASFWHGHARWPGVMMEVACSGKTNPNKKNPEGLARKYIEQSRGAVRAVVCVDITYNINEDGEKEVGKGELSVWRPYCVKAKKGYRLVARPDLTGMDKVFRDESGNPTEHPGLRLRLADFVDPPISEDISVDENRHIVIPGDKLFKYLNEMGSTRYLGPGWATDSPAHCRGLPPGTILEEESESSSDESASNNEPIHAGADQGEARVSENEASDHVDA